MSDTFLREKKSAWRNQNRSRSDLCTIERSQFLEPILVVLTDVPLSCFTETCGLNVSVYSVWFSREPKNLQLLSSGTWLSAQNKEELTIRYVALKTGNLLYHFCYRHVPDCLNWGPNKKITCEQEGFLISTSKFLGTVGTDRAWSNQAAHWTFSRTVNAEISIFLFSCTMNGCVYHFRNRVIVERLEDIKIYFSEVLPIQDECNFTACKIQTANHNLIFSCSVPSRASTFIPSFDVLVPFFTLFCARSIWLSTPS